MEDNPEMCRFICDALADEFQVALGRRRPNALDAALASPPTCW
ncbi:MAG: hypothetical protein R3E70_15810 [Burkholderiaceae bacterium]